MPCFMNRAAGIIIATRLKHIGTTTCFLLIHWYVKSKLSAIQRRIAQCRVTFWDHGTTIGTVVFCGANELCTVWTTKTVIFGSQVCITQAFFCPKFLPINKGTPLLFLNYYWVKGQKRKLVPCSHKKTKILSWFCLRS